MRCVLTKQCFSVLWGYDVENILNAICACVAKFDGYFCYLCHVYGIAVWRLCIMCNVYDISL